MNEVCVTSTSTASLIKGGTFAAITDCVSYGIDSNNEYYCLRCAANKGLTNNSTLKSKTCTINLASSNYDSLTKPVVLVNFKDG